MQIASLKVKTMNIKDLEKELRLSKGVIASNDFCNTEYNCLSFYQLINLCFTDYILCNNIVDLDESVIENIFELNNIDEDEDFEVYQYFIVNKNNYNFEKYGDNFMMSYSDKLDCDILCVTHFGTSWSYIPTNVKLEKGGDE